MNPNPNPPSPYSNPRVQEQTNKLAMHSLFAKMVEPPVDRDLAINTMKYDIKGVTELEQLGNDWFLLKFATKEHKDFFEDSKPHLIQGHLLALYPWSESFNPITSEPTRVDLWARIPLLPLPLFGEEALHLILKGNNVGELIDIDHASNAENKMRFARVFVIVDMTRPLVRMVSFRNEVGAIVHLRVWYEGYSPGCGCCGEEGHVIGDCPLVCVQPRKFHVVLEEDNPAHEALIQESRRVILGGVEAELVDEEQASEESEDGKRKEAEENGDVVASPSKKAKKEDN